MLMLKSTELRTKMVTFRKNRMSLYNKIRAASGGGWGLATYSMVVIQLGCQCKL